MRIPKQAMAQNPLLAGEANCLAHMNLWRWNILLAKLRLYAEYVTLLTGKIAANSCIDATKMIKDIIYQHDSWHITIHGQRCIFTKTLQLYTTGLLPLQPNTTKGLRWRINRRWVSYNQIKKAIKS